METNQTRAVIVTIPENEQKALADFLNDYGEDYKDNETQEWASKIYEAKAIDFDALRLVLEAAKESTEREGESYNNLSPESRAGLRQTIAAIAKIEAII